MVVANDAMGASDTSSYSKHDGTTTPMGVDDLALDCCVEKWWATEQQQNILP